MTDDNFDILLNSKTVSVIIVSLLLREPAIVGEVVKTHCDFLSFLWDLP